MTPHGSSTRSTTSVPRTPNPYAELAPPGSPPADPPSRNPYEELAAEPDPAEGPGAPHGSTGRTGPSGPSGSSSQTDTPHAGGALDEGPLGFTFRPDDGPDDPDSEHSGHSGYSGYSDYEERMPYLRAVRRRRRSRLWLLIKCVVGCVVLLAFLFVADRWAALYAEGKAAEKVKDSLNLHAEPEVHIRGFPFLTQLAGDRLDHVEVTIPDMPAGRISVAQVSGSVRDVRIVGDAPTSIRGAVLGSMRADVLLEFDDLDRELGTSQVGFSSGGPNTVLADGKLPVAGEEVAVRARAHLRRDGDKAVGTTVDNMLLRVPGRFRYTPGENGGLLLDRPVAERIQRDAEKARALFEVRAFAERFGLTPERAQRVRASDRELSRVTRKPTFTRELMQVNVLDVAVRNPALLEKLGIDPALVAGLRKIEEPELAERLSLSVSLPDLPGEVRLRSVSVVKEGIRAKVTGSGVPFGSAAEKDGKGGR
ncbi:DUF2993 domain-containing protein [Streptomyces sp. AJS327]|uniref:LmeA family phospholipid-binding protein n=1 Tax=Streptomyces sp. AJS327 TaxID=2545265 RepID=UPI0015DDA6A7|nr:DUF2993 domain-containing protein [Streptomyces sp. AJS327]MBA0054133.1 DUF2993 domain-containing protein [Streptomyces sp. AJS327]